MIAMRIKMYNKKDIIEFIISQDDWIVKENLSNSFVARHISNKFLIQFRERYFMDARLNNDKSVLVSYNDIESCSNSFYEKNKAILGIEEDITLFELIVLVGEKLKLEKGI